MVLIDDNVSQSKIVDNSQFVCEPSNIDLRIENYYFLEKQSDPKSLKNNTM